MHDAGRAPVVRRTLLASLLALLLPLLGFAVYAWRTQSGHDLSGGPGLLLTLVGASVLCAGLALRNAWRVTRPIQDLERAEARFRALTELSSDWYWEQDADQRFTFLSSGHERVTGERSERFIGRTVEELEGAVLGDAVLRKRA